VAEAVARLGGALELDGSAGESVECRGDRAAPEDAAGVPYLFPADDHTYRCRSWDDWANRLLWAHRQGFRSAKARRTGSEEMVEESGQITRLESELAEVRELLAALVRRTANGGALPEAEARHQTA
jgi:hypothetical protein